MASTPASHLRAASLAIPIDGQPFQAELTSIDANWRLTFKTESKQVAMPAVDLVRWGDCPGQGRAGGLVLADGALIVARVTTADKERLTAASESLGTFSLPLDALAGVILRPPSDPTERDRLPDRIRAARGESDRVWLENGDEVAGLFTGVRGDALLWRTDAGPVDLKTDRVVAVIFNPALRRKPAPARASLHAWIGLADGTRLLATQLVLDGDALQLVAAGQPLAAPRRSLVFLQPVGGRAVYLSDLKPAAYHQTPYLDLSWPYRADRNVTGGPLRCGNQLFLKGLGVHSAARLEFTISPRPLGEGAGVRADGTSPRPLGEGQGVRAKRFESLVAIDDSVAPVGSVRFRVLVDGQERFASPILRGGDAPLSVSVDVTGAKKLELIVDRADRADVLDHADWLDARLTD